MTSIPTSRSATGSIALPLLGEIAVAAILREHQDTARRAVRSVLGFSTDEEDLVQEVLTRLVIRLRQPGEITVGAWTWRVAHNLAVDHLRSRRATPTDVALLDRGVGEGLDTQVIGSQLADAIHHGLAKLPDRQRDALLAQAALDGDRGGHALVAANLGVSAKAAESILARARQSLRRELDRVGVREAAWVAAGVALVRTVRGLARTNVAIAGAVAIVAVSAMATSVLVFHAPLTRSTSSPPTPGRHGVPLSQTIAGPPGSTSLTPSSSVAAGSVSPASWPPIQASPSIPSQAGVSLPRVTDSIPSTATLPGVSVPAAILPATTIPGRPTISLLPPVTLPTVSVPVVPKVTIPAARVPVLSGGTGSSVLPGPVPWRRRVGP